MSSILGNAPQYAPMSQMIESVPESLSSSSNRQPIHTSYTTTRVAAMSQGKPGSEIRVNIPTGPAAGYMCEPYIVLTCQPTGTFQNGHTGWQFKGPTKSAYITIQNYTSYFGAVLGDQLNYINKVFEDIINHQSCPGYITADFAQMAYAGRTGLDTAAQNVGAVSVAGKGEAFTVCLPLVGILASKNQSFPLFLLNSPLQLVFQFAPLNNIWCESGNTAAGLTDMDYTLSIVYKKIDTSYDFANQVKQEMANGLPYSMDYHEIKCQSQVATQGNQARLFGLQASSLRGVLLSQILTTDLTATAFDANPVLGKCHSISNKISQFQISVDGFIRDFPLNWSERSIMYAETCKALHKLFDSQIVANMVNYSDYDKSTFLIGKSFLRVSNDSSLSMIGTPCGTLTINYLNVNGDVTQFLTTIVDAILNIDAGGNVSIVR